MKKDPNKYPRGWNRKKVEYLIRHYENQTDEEAAALAREVAGVVDPFDQDLVAPEQHAAHGVLLLRPVPPDAQCVDRRREPARPPRQGLDARERHAERRVQSDRE